MASQQKLPQGWDAQAIRRIATNYYGGYANMFEAHGWPERSQKMMTAAQGRVVEVYGSVKAFEEAHPASDLMFPMEAIKSDPPNVWLTSFYSFRPEEWGFVGFTGGQRRKAFLEGTRPGVLVVIYGSGQAADGELGRILGIQQCSHQLGDAERFMLPSEWDRSQSDPDRAGRWNDAVKTTRAWRVTPETRMNVRQFAPKATATRAWQHIGTVGVPLSTQEALNILKLDLQECSVYGENPIIESSAGTAKEVLAPSKAGPVSQTPFLTKESEGPKHLYLLKLIGDTDAFLGEPADGKIIVKAGFSRSPATRCHDHNRALPQGAFRWEVLHSGTKAGFEAYPSSGHAKAGERAMQNVLLRKPGGRSLGGEFFLADASLIEEAWTEGNSAAARFET